MRAKTFIETLLGMESEALNEQELEDIFLLFDWSGTGHVDRDSLQRVLGFLDMMLRPNEQDQLAQKLGLVSSKRGSPGVGLEEFKEIYVEALGSRMPARYELDWAFRCFDRDGDGLLSLDDFKVGFYAACPTDISNAQVEWLFHTMDANRDGSVTWEEFIMFAAINFGRFFCGAMQTPSRKDIKSLPPVPSLPPFRSVPSLPSKPKTPKGSPKGFVLIDVRTQAEFSKKSLRGSRAVPVAASDDPKQVMQRAIAEGRIPADRTARIIIFSNSATGGGSEKAALALQKLGYARAANGGSIDTLHEAGIPWM
jgi:Ca2+-binding EF-hand superfamily protein/rhodanese-related sulfurtransferase